MWYATVPTGPRIADVFSDEVHANKMGPIIWTLANCPTVGHIMNSVTHQCTIDKKYQNQFLQKNYGPFVWSGTNRKLLSTYGHHMWIDQHVTEMWPIYWATVAWETNMALSVD